MVRWLHRTQRISPRHSCRRHGQSAAALKRWVSPPIVRVRYYRWFLLLWISLGEPGIDPAKAGVPLQIELSPMVAQLLDDPVTTPTQRREMAVFHGQWDRVDDPTLAEQAAIAMQRYDLNHPSLHDPTTPAIWRARAALERGESRLAVEWLQGDASAEAAVVKAQAYEQLGQWRQAVDCLQPWRDRLHEDTIDEADQLTAAAQALLMLAQLEGRPTRDYQLAMSLLGKAHGELDRLYWPALLVEAQWLIEKDNAKAAGDALTETLQLNPRCGPAWHHLGMLACNGYDFNAAQHCVTQLREIHPQHLLADLLESQILLTQKDVLQAFEVIHTALSRYPNQQRLLAQHVAALAVSSQPKQYETALTRFHQLYPRSPLAALTAGRYLSMARQYKQGQVVLREAIELAPHWPKPRIELGLLLMQAGHESMALEVLRQAANLDPFNRRAGNQFKLAQQLSQYDQIRTEHFVIKYQPGVDEVLARDMSQALEPIYDRVTRAFQYEPPRPTQIEILPDEQTFGVRITGLPDIWTIAACTGDVIALTPPRLGARQRGAFDWPRVIEHEFVHTVTLNMTQYHIPHWLTEACAVRQEPGERDYETCQLLAWALTEDKLFGLDQINWAFIRPQTQHDRPLAYAQASWMLEFLVERFGHKAMLDLLGLLRDRATDVAAVQQVTGWDTPRFMAQFKNWAQQQITAWGLQPQPQDARVEAFLQSLSRENESPDASVLEGLLEEYPDHPDLLKQSARIALMRGDDTAARGAILEYASVRPIDPWADHQWIKLAGRMGDTPQAVASLERLDAMEVRNSQWAVQLATLHRRMGQLDEAGHRIERALHREPYRADHRELAAAIHLQRNDPTAALRHLQAMAILEPRRAVHQIRLAALYTRMSRTQDAQAAAREALRLDPDAPVNRFLSSPK